MAVEDQVRELFKQFTPQPEVGIDVERRGGPDRRRRSRRTALATGTAIVLTVAGIGAVRLLDPDAPKRPSPLPAPVMVWKRAPDMPLTPRWDPFTIWTGTEALVIGGDSRDVVGGPAPVADLRDGAAFDPANSTWRTIADAPVAVGSRSYGPALVVKDTVVIARGNHWLAYDISTDQWRTLPSPSANIPQATVAADPSSGLVYAVDRYVEEGDDAPVQVLDLTSDVWSSLPASTQQPQLDDRSLVFTDAGLVVMGDDLFPRQAGRQRETSRAELWDGESWSRFADSQINGGEWHWTGKRVIATNPVTQRDSSGDGRHGFRAGALDPSDGRWSALPWLPGHPAGLLDGGWSSSDGDLVFTEGYLYDDSDQSYRSIPAPDDSLNRTGVALGDGQLMTFGGYHVDPGKQQSRVIDVAVTNETWVMTVR